MTNANNYSYFKNVNGYSHLPSEMNSNKETYLDLLEKKKMPRFLIGTIPLVGHVNPALPIARQLVNRGHEVWW